jgi:hypothetical protein
MIHRKKHHAHSKHHHRQDFSTSFPCPHCGTQVGSLPDLGGGERQTYIEDCPTCCRPNRITAVLDEAGRDFKLEVVAED